jgi:hypothetical protein
MSNKVKSVVELNKATKLAHWSRMVETTASRVAHSSFLNWFNAIQNFHSHSNCKNYKKCSWRGKGQLCGLTQPDEVAAYVENDVPVTPIDGYASLTGVNRKSDTWQ